MRAKFSVTCTAVYDSSLDIPNELIIKNEDDEVTEESKTVIADYIKEHLSECNCESALEWLANDDEFGGDVTIFDDDNYFETFRVDYP